ncbi:HAD-IIB family hydrolase [Thalassovita sp.]|jgi:mannosyl-3-phosphoglycerate phosphatase|uniref:HAD-IIB family hydrolase n=1 Tax=Thalassovita sp. TaxID=1979401 RepID=UPI003B5C96C4
MTEFSAIVFTDLDGTLLDHHSYDYTPALPALNALAQRGIPVILASSKTAAEIAPLRKELNLSAHPAIVENGAGLLPAGASSAGDNSAYLDLRAALDQVPSALRGLYIGFGDMTARDVADHTGLPLPQAELAKTRNYSEPGIWTGTPEQQTEFQNALTALGVSCRFGGRYLTLSFGRTKADQMEAIRAMYGATTMIALGDAPNDVEMLEAADHPILITNAQAKPLTVPGTLAPRLTRSTLPGPSGWNETISALLAALPNDPKGA